MFLLCQYRKNPIRTPTQNEEIHGENMRWAIFGDETAKPYQKLIINTGAPTVNHVTWELILLNSARSRFAYRGAINMQKPATNLRATRTDIAHTDGWRKMWEPATNSHVVGTDVTRTDITREDCRQKRKNPLQSPLSHVLVQQIVRLMRFPSGDQAMSDGNWGGVQCFNIFWECLARETGQAISLGRAFVQNFTAVACKIF